MQLARTAGVGQARKAAPAGPARAAAPAKARPVLRAVPSARQSAPREDEWEVF